MPPIAIIAAIATIIAAIATIIMCILPMLRNLWRKHDVEISVSRDYQSPPIFKVFIQNHRGTDIVVQDVRLMINRRFGFQSEKGTELNKSIPSGRSCQFNFPAENVSRRLKELYYPTIPTTDLKITPRCILGSGRKRSIKGDSTSVSTDPGKYVTTISTTNGTREVRT